MKLWLKTEYQAVLFSESDPVAYALYKRHADSIHLRQFFVRRDRRRMRIGHAAVAILRDEIWPKNVRLTVDVLCCNHGAVSFWRSVGYGDYCLSLEICPSDNREPNPHGI